MSPIYEYEAENGERMDVYAEMADAPRIGDQITDHEGRVWTRVASNPQASVKADRHFVSNSLPGGYKYHRMAGGKFDRRGRPLFDSQRQVEETVACANQHGEELSYDDGGIGDE